MTKLRNFKAGILLIALVAAVTLAAWQYMRRTGA